MDETKLDDLFEEDTGWFLYSVDTLFRNIQAKKSKHTDTKNAAKNCERSSKRSRPPRMELTGVGHNAMWDLAMLGLRTNLEHEVGIE